MLAMAFALGAIVVMGLVVIYMIITNSPKKIEKRDMPVIPPLSGPNDL